MLVTVPVNKIRSGCCNCTACRCSAHVQDTLHSAHAIEPRAGNQFSPSTYGGIGCHCQVVVVAWASRLAALRRLSLPTLSVKTKTASSPAGTAQAGRSHEADCDSPLKLHAWPRSWRVKHTRQQRKRQHLSPGRRRSCAERRPRRCASSR